MSNDWFCRSTWTKADEADFFARFKRSRGFGNKAQYLVRQADRLERVGSKKLLQASLMLLDKMLAEFPEEFHLAEAHGQKASCLAKPGDPEGAIKHYRLALKAERDFPYHQTPVAYDFGMFVVENKIQSVYDEALAAVKHKAKTSEIKFPREVYKYHGIHALVAADRQDHANAKKWAQTALEAAGETDSGVKRHSGFGLVENLKTKFHKSLKAIVA